MPLQQMLCERCKIRVVAQELNVPAIRISGPLWHRIDGKPSDTINLNSLSLALSLILLFFMRIVALSLIRHAVVFNNVC